MGLIMPNYAQKIYLEEKKDKNILTQVRFELGTFGMWSQSANHYTTKTLEIFFPKIIVLVKQCENLLAGNSNDQILSNSSPHYPGLKGQRRTQPLFTLFWYMMN